MIEFSRKVIWVLRNEGLVAFVKKKTLLYYTRNSSTDTQPGEQEEAKAKALEKKLNSGQFEEVIDEALKLIKESPTYFVYYRLAGQSYLELKNYRQANHYFLKAKLFDKRKGRATASLAEVAYKGGDLSKGNTLFEQALFYGDSNTKIYNQWIVVSIHTTGKIPTDLLRRAISEAPLDQKYTIEWVDRLFRSGKHKEMKDEVSAYINTFLEKYPDNVEAQTLRFEIDYIEKGTPVLDKWLSKINFEKPDYASCVIPAKALSAYAVKNADLLKKYLKILVAIITHFPKEDFAYVDMGNACRMSEANTPYAPFELSPQKDQALDCYLAATLQPGKAGRAAHVMALEALLRKRDFFTFDLNAQKLLRAPDVHNYKGLYSALSTRYLAKQNLPEALKYRLKSIESDGPTHDNMLSMARIALAAQRKQTAIKYIEAANKRKNDVPSIQRSAAELELELGLVTKAKKRLESLVDAGVSEVWMKDFGETLDKYPTDSNSVGRIARIDLREQGKRQVRTLALDSDWIIVAKPELELDSDELESAIAGLSSHKSYIYDDSGIMDDFSSLPAAVAVKTRDLNTLPNLSFKDALSRIILRMRGQYLPTWIICESFEELPDLDLSLEGTLGSC